MTALAVDVICTITNTAHGVDNVNVGKKAIIVRKNDVDHPDFGPMWTVKSVNGDDFELEMYGKFVKQPLAAFAASWLEPVAGPV